MGIDFRVYQRREEGEVVHRHRDFTTDKCIVHFRKEGVAASRGLTAFVQGSVELYSFNGFRGVYDADDIVILVLPLTPKTKEGIFDTHGQGIVVSLGVSRQPIKTIIRAGEKHGNIT